MTSFPTRQLIMVAAGVTMMVASGCNATTDEPAADVQEIDVEETEVQETTTTVASDSPASLSVLDPVHNRPFDVMLWAPGSGANSTDLVVISHGFAGDATSHAAMAEGLADRGYTVVASTHPDLAGLESGNPELDPLVLRPRHLSLVIDHVESTEGPFNSVTVVGHSLGGYSSMRVVGADPSSDGIEPHCAAAPSDPVLCTDQAKRRFEGLAARSDVVVDHRIDRAVLLAPAYGPLFQADDLADIAVPILVIQSEEDTSLPGDQVERLVDHLPASPGFETVPGGHYVFLRPCSADESAAVPELCEDPAGVDREATAQQLASMIDEFAATS